MARQRYGYSYVSAFTVHDEQLALLTVAEGARHSLPYEVLRHDQTHEHAAEVALDNAFGDARPTIEPLIDWSQSKVSGAVYAVGNTAVVTLMEPERAANARPVPLSAVADPAIGLSALEIDLVAWGIKKLRPYERGDWNYYLGDRCGPDYGLSILSRLVSDPRRFVIAELRTAFEAYLSAPLPGQTREAHKINPQNFHGTMAEKLIPTGEYTQHSTGRPAQFYSMPERILSPL